MYDILLNIGDFDLAIRYKRFWAASRLFDIRVTKASKVELMNIIPYFSIKQKNDTIIFASRHGKVDVIALLLRDPRMNPSQKNNEAIRWASSNGHKDVVKLLLVFDYTFF